MAKLGQGARRRAKKRREAEAYAKVCALRVMNAEGFGFADVCRVTRTGLKKGDAWLRKARELEPKELRMSRALCF